MKNLFASIVLPALALLTLSCSRYTPPPENPRPGSNTGNTGNTGSSGNVGNAGGAMEASIFSYINNYRRSKGLANLQVSDAITRQAELHSRNMATGKTAFGHDGFDQRVKNISAALGRISASAENVAYGSETARQVVDGWLNSSGHRKNIEGNYNLTGIGVYADRRGVLYFTQLFARQ